MRRALTATSLALTLAIPLGAPVGVPLAAQPADTTRISTEPLFGPVDALVAAGFVVGTLALHPVDRRLAERIQDSSVQAISLAKDAASGFNLIGYPGTYVIGAMVYTAGKISKNREIADLGLHGTEALLVGHALTALLKGSFGRARPFVNPSDPNDWKFLRGFQRGGRYMSFPSGHSTAGFAAAAAVTAETSRWWPGSTWFIAPVMYGGAALIGLARMYDNRHWASDVFMGAAIGTFAGIKVVKYHHSHPGNRIDRWLLGTTIIPDGTGGAVVAFWAFPR